MPEIAFVRELAGINARDIILSTWVKFTAPGAHSQLESIIYAQAVSCPVPALVASGAQRVCSSDDHIL